MDADRKIILPRINRLPDSLANQIAAGEVIERPASVVKELLENSIDAGASRIELDVEQGGARSIRVSDNGCGIHADDMRLALERHATSKLHSQADLECINTLGFRGEALPSIASVCQFKLISRSLDAEQAYSLSFDPNLGEPEYLPAARSLGTTVEVNKLFFNTPARRKFLRTERTEFLHILEMTRRLALGCEHIAIRLRHNEKQVLYCPTASTESAQRVYALMGAEFRDKAIRIEYANDAMRLYGFLGASELARNQSDRQYFYLNGRMIRDKKLNHAIRLAYDARIVAGRYPCYVLYLQMDMSKADVNVHPTKHEVRFHQARDVHDFVYASLCDALSQNNDMVGNKEQLSLKQKAGYSDKNIGQIREATGYYGALSRPGPSQGLFKEAGKLGRPVAQLQGHFIVTESQSCLRLVDVHAARRHIALTRLKTSGAEQLPQQRPLLVPVTVSFPAPETELFLRHITTLEKHGLCLEQASRDSLIVRSIPVVLQDCDIESLMNDILGVLSKGDNDALLTVMAHHAADIQDENLSRDAMNQLLMALENCLDKDTQPAGLFRSLSLQDLKDLIHSNEC